MTAPDFPDSPDSPEDADVQLSDDGYVLDSDGNAWGHCNACGEEAPAESICCDDGEVVPD